MSPQSDLFPRIFPFRIPSDDGKLCQQAVAASRAGSASRAGGTERHRSCQHRCEGGAANPQHRRQQRVVRGALCGAREIGNGVRSIHELRIWILEGLRGGLNIEQGLRGGLNIDLDFRRI